jgi:hypothetical protein
VAKDDTSQDAPASATIVAATFAALFFTGIAALIVFALVAG